jgi:hypothetical protein
MGGEKQAKMMKDAMLQEKKDWLDKVVVDNLTLKVGPPSSFLVCLLPPLPPSSFLVCLVVS